MTVPLAVVHGAADPFMSVGLQGSYILTPDPDRLSNRRLSRLFSYFSYSTIQLYQVYYSASLSFLSAVNYRAELYILLYNYGNTLIYLYLDLQSEYYHLSLHFFFDPCRATDILRRPTFMADASILETGLVGTSRSLARCTGLVPDSISCVLRPSPVEITRP
jgi:hypothetical protein